MTVRFRRRAADGTLCEAGCSFPWRTALRRPLKTLYMVHKTWQLAGMSYDEGRRTTVAMAEQARASGGIADFVETDPDTGRTRRW